MGTPLQCKRCDYKFWSTSEYNESGWDTNCRGCGAVVIVDESRVDPSQMPDEGVVIKADDECKPCPFCGCEELIIDDFVNCTRCHAYGPDKERSLRSLTATEIWNSRV